MILLDFQRPRCEFLVDHIEPVLWSLFVVKQSVGSDLKQTLEIGVLDYIRKPMDEVEVVVRVQSALRLKQYRECAVNFLRYLC